jgi:hypothetical protein
MKPGKRLSRFWVCHIYLILGISLHELSFGEPFDVFRVHTLDIGDVLGDRPVTATISLVLCTE